jgi:hypothetical protein
MPLSLDFAFEGFRIIREKPKLILFWGLVLLIGGGLGQLLLVAIGGPALERLAGLAPSTDPNVLLPLYSKLFAAYAALLPVLMVTNAIIACAVFRATWGEPDDRFGYLRFGADEWRQIAVSILFLLIYLALAFAVSLIAGPIAGLAGDKAGAVAAPVLALGFAAIVVILLRLSLCNVQSFDQKRITMFDSWKLTRGRGWTLLGGYVVAGIMAVFVVALCGAIYGAVTIGLYGGDWSTLNIWLTQPDMTSLQAYLKPLMIGWLIYSNLFISPLVIALLSGAQAAAYRTLAGQTPDNGI